MAWRSRHSPNRRPPSGEALPTSIAVEVPLAAWVPSAERQDFCADRRTTKPRNRGLSRAEPRDESSSLLRRVSNELAAFLAAARGRWPHGRRLSPSSRALAREPAPQWLHASAASPISKIIWRVIAGLRCGETTGLAHWCTLACECITAYALMYSPAIRYAERAGPKR